MSTPFHFPRLTRVMQVGGVDVYLHWSVMLIGSVILLGAFDRPAETLTGWSCYFGVLLIHECGHMIVVPKGRVRGTRD